MAQQAEDTAILAGGCFWCTEAVFQRVKGVNLVESGYIGGQTEYPTYEQVCQGNTGHAEAIRIHFDPNAVSYSDLLDIFFATHNPTELDRQGNDIGTQYRSAIFPQSPVQHQDALAAIERAQKDWDDPIVTRIEFAGPWWPAEEEHDSYFNRVGDRNPYCTVVIAPKVGKLMEHFPERVQEQE